MNVEELDSCGKTIVQWCFAPQGHLVVGDVLLAQKIALETMEREALAAANRQVYRATLPDEAAPRGAISWGPAEIQVARRSGGYPTASLRP
jgi:hypothetical protein